MLVVFSRSRQSFRSITSGREGKSSPVVWEVVVELGGEGGGEEASCGVKSRLLLRAKKRFVGEVEGVWLLLGSVVVSSSKRLGLCGDGCGGGEIGKVKSDFTI